MPPEKKVEKLSKEFLTLKEQEKNYILGLTRALDYAAREGKYSDFGADKKGVKNEKQMV